MRAYENVSCRSCLSYTFSSECEKRRHCSVVHRLTPKETAKLNCSVNVVAEKNRQWVCGFKENGNVCQLPFRTKRALVSHQHQQGHRKRGHERAEAARVSATMTNDGAESSSSDSGDAVAADEANKGNESEEDEGGDSHDDDMEVDGNEEKEDNEGDDGSEGDDTPDTNYYWFDSTPKSVSFAEPLHNDMCQECDLDIQKESYRSGKAIECNMCYFTWHIKCLKPAISVEQCLADKFFVCSDICKAECDAHLQQ